MFLRKSLTFFEIRQTGLVDDMDANKNVMLPVVRLDESVTLAKAEPFYGPALHIALCAYRLRTENSDDAKMFPCCPTSTAFSRNTGAESLYETPERPCSARLRPRSTRRAKMAGC